MKNLLLIFALAVSMFSNAQQTSFITVTEFTSGGQSYLNLNGDDNGVVPCFDNVIIGDSYVLSIDLNSDGTLLNVYRDDAPYLWTGHSAAVTVLNFGRWDDYNRNYLVRDNGAPVRVSDDILSCGGWTVGPGGQIYSNPGFPGYTYNDFPNPGGISAYVYYNGVRIPFGVTSVDRAALEVQIGIAIGNHMGSLSTAQGFSSHFE